jgi:hypothetical protein
MSGIRDQVWSSGVHGTPALAHPNVDLLDRASQRDPYLPSEYVVRTCNLGVVVPRHLLLGRYPNLGDSKAGSRRVFCHPIEGFP